MLFNQLANHGIGTLSKTTVAYILLHSQKSRLFLLGGFGNLGQDQHLRPALTDNDVESRKSARPVTRRTEKLEKYAIDNVNKLKSLGERATEIHRVWNTFAR